MMRQTAFLFRGKYSSMLDMGGVGQAAATKRINVGKNNKIRAIILDFHLITRSIKERRALAEEEIENGRIQNNIAKAAATAPTSHIQPDTSVVESFANLLGVKLGDSVHKKKQEDDLSGLLGNIDNSVPEKKETVPKKAFPSSSHSSDIRSKYSQKLRNKIEGGVAGLDLAKFEKEDTLKRGDASMHLAARNLITAEGSAGTSTSSSRWLATTGVGKLLSFVDGRSMQIVLLPLPSTPTMSQSDEDVKRTLEEMTSLTRQLPNVNFDLLIADGRRRGKVGTDAQNDNTAQDVLTNVLSTMDDIDPIQFLLVSDREDYLGAARDEGIFTCRVRPLNKRRGLTTNYNVDDVGSVEEVINDINGVSFNSALKAR
uniref:Uncharacterized protein n=1 Tax=Skeletonema marinoi TaxID=267567 RepID=A0A7S2M4X7_9STRA|mmetsp:Transcript_4881/g.8356  ORF Transcript_4881/g.8356 Transcript_4881/m.8356 type:complete len:371 (+) Transcript_4881:50-1162(+)